MSQRVAGVPPVVATGVGVACALRLPEGQCRAPTIPCAKLIFGRIQETALPDKLGGNNFLKVPNLLRDLGGSIAEKRLTELY